MDAGNAGNGRRRGDPASVIVVAQSRVRSMMRRGTSFEQVETMIERVTGLNDDQKSALWMYAWALQSRPALERETRRTLEMVATD